MLVPAHRTKHLPVLNYSFAGHEFRLFQCNDGRTNGTALWLGAQCLSLYLADSKIASPPASRKAIELGSGIGLTSLALGALGWDVLATDVPVVISSVLRQNIAQNTGSLTGTVQVRELDWTVPPEEWTWTNGESTAGSPAACPVPESLSGPFDLIVTADTLYSPALTEPLLRAIHGLCDLSIKNGKSPMAYVCIERRDSSVIDNALASARDKWGFSIARIPHENVARAMLKGGVDWREEDWEGVEIWKFRLGKKPKLAARYSQIGRLLVP